MPCQIFRIPWYLQCGVLVFENLRSICIVPWIGSRYNFIHTELITESFFEYYVPHTALFWSYNTERRSFPADRPKYTQKNATRKGQEGTQCLQASLSADEIPAYTH